MTPTEPATPIDERVLADLLAEEAALAQGSTLDDEPNAARRGLRECLRLLRTLGPETGAEPVTAGTLRLGRFTILGEVGRGGFGIVYRAHDPMLGRDVALKVPRPELIASPDVQRRFLREARAAAGLDHPHIVPVLDVGPLGPVCYIASAFCPGPTLAGWLRDRSGPVSPRLAARLVADLAAGVAHAHGRGVLHRDIKPSNILFTRPAPEDGPEPPVPRLTDFGLAKLAEEAGDDTRTLAVLGSPPYMAPEQAAGRNHEVGPATDVHALGSVLYEVLLGRPPFMGESRSETLRQVMEAEPIRPHTLRPRLPRDLETIVLTCLAKRPTDRYVTAEALAEDLGRFLADEPIRARPRPLRRRAWDAVRRRPTLAASALLVALALAVAVGMLAWSNRRQGRAIARLVAETKRADGNAREASLQTRLAERHLLGAQLRLAGEALDDGQFERAQDILHELEPAPGAPDLRGFAWHALWRIACREIRPLYGHERAVRSLAVAPDGRMLATADHGGTVRLWDLATDRPIGTLRGPGGPAGPLDFSPDGRLLASLVSLPGGRCEPRVWDMASGRPAASLGGFDSWSGGEVGFTADGDTLWVSAYAAPGSGQRILRYALKPASSVPARETSLRAREELRVCPDGRVVALVVDGATAADHWTPAAGPTGYAVWTMSGHPSLGVPWAVTADSRIVAAAIHGGDVVCREARTGAEVARFGREETVFQLDFSPDGRTLAVGSHSGTVDLIELATGRVRSLAVGSPVERAPTYWLRFSPDSSRLATNFWGGPGGSTAVTLWEVATGRRLAAYPGRRDRIADLAFAPDGRSLLMAVGPTVRRWWPEPAPEPASPLGHADEAWSLAFAPDGRTLATGSDDTDEPATIKVWDPATGRLVRGWNGGRGTVAALSYAPDGRLLASGHLEERDNLRLWDTATGRLRATLAGHAQGVRALAFLPDGERLASAGTDRAVRLWDVASGRVVWAMSEHGLTVQGLACAPDGRSLASASSDQTVCVWDATTGRLLKRLRGAQKFTAVAYAPDSRTLAATDEEGTLTLWDPATGAHRGSIHCEDAIVRTLAYAPDGRSIAAAGEGGTITVWDVITHQRLLAMPARSNLVHALGYSPEGRILASCDHEGHVRLWRGE